MNQQERLLQDDQIMVQLWGEAAQEIFHDEWSIDQQADAYGDSLANAVSDGQLSMRALRDLHARAKQLDHAAFEACFGDMEALSDADYFEAVARRIAHHSLNHAVNLLRSDKRRLDHGRKLRMKSNGNDDVYVIAGSQSFRDHGRNDYLLF